MKKEILLAESGTVLVADDAPANLDLLVQQLNQAGFKVLVSRSGSQALRLAETARPDLVLLDVMMPEMDGFETCRRLKANPLTRRIPVIFMTALSDTASKLKGFELGAVDYVTKPIEQLEILARVKTHMALQQLKQELEERVEARTRQLQAEIMEHRRTELLLRESEDRFRRVITSISDHIYMTKMTDAGERMNLYLSPNIELLTGYPQDRFMGDWHFWSASLIHPEDRQAAAAHAGRLATGRGGEIEYRLIRANGDIIWVRDSARVETAGNVKIVYGVISDITGRKRAEEELRRHQDRLEDLVAERTAALQVANEQLKELDRLKSEFVSNVSHELRTPLANIKLYAALSQKGRSDKQQHYLHTIQTETERLEMLIEDILDLSRLERGGIKPVIEPQPLSPVVRQVVEAHLPVAQSKEISLAWREPAEPVTVAADRSQLLLMLNNLVSNALTYTSPGGRVEISAQIGRWLDRPAVGITVRDTGIGIPLDQQTFIFERFYRGRHTPPGIPGTGLGLAIVRESIHLHGGEVTVESAEGQGSAFTLWFPH